MLTKTEVQNILNEATLCGNLHTTYKLQENGWLVSKITNYGHEGTDVDVICIDEIAKAIDSKSAYWHTVLEELMQWYYAHLPWEEFNKTKECLDFMSEHFHGMSLTNAVNKMHLVFRAYQGYYRSSSRLYEYWKLDISAMTDCQINNLDRCIELMQDININAERAIYRTLNIK